MKPESVPHEALESFSFSIDCERNVPRTRCCTPEQTAYAFRSKNEFLTSLRAKSFGSLDSHEQSRAGAPSLQMSNLSKSESERAVRLASVTPAGVAVTVSEFGATIPSVPPDRPIIIPKDGDRIVGMEIDHFRVERRIGSGGMGAVYLAHDMSLDRQVAIKVLPDEYAVNPEAQERFMHEARAQARLVSPHIVRIYYIGRVPRADDNHRKSLYFAMEFVDGGSLEAIVERRERLDPEKARLWMIQAVRGLRAAYAAGLVHRDIKPGNMLLDQQDTIKIADFGLAKPMGARDHCRYASLYFSRTNQ
jgi:serine/threonine protein kinase